MGVCGYLGGVDGGLLLLRREEKMDRQGNRTRLRRVQGVLSFR